LAGVNVNAQEQPEQPTHTETHVAAVAHHEGIPVTAAEHETAAQRLVDEAQHLAQRAAEHEHDAVEYRKRAHAVSNYNYANLADHCTHLAKTLRASAAEAREMARLHHDAAKLTSP